jgi:hypothetical protein
MILYVTVATHGYSPSYYIERWSPLWRFLNNCLLFFTANWTWRFGFHVKVAEQLAQDRDTSDGVDVTAFERRAPTYASRNRRRSTIILMLSNSVVWCSFFVLTEGKWSIDGKTGFTWFSL